MYNLKLYQASSVCVKPNTCDQGDYHKLFLTSAKWIDVKQLSSKHFDDTFLPKGSTMLLDLDMVGSAPAICAKGFSDLLLNGSKDAAKSVVGIFMR